MKQELSLVTLVVRDYDEAISWFCGKLRFRLASDTDLGGSKRWVTVEPPGGGTRVLLARAADEQESRAIGNQTGGRVAFFLQTDDFHRDHATMLAAGVRFCEEPRHESYGIVAVFEDLHGNYWDLIEPKHPL